MPWIILSAASAAAWLLIVVLLWRPWETREFLEAEPQTARRLNDTDDDTAHMDNVTVIIPARNEAVVLKQTLSAVIDQSENIAVILVDDSSTDDTIRIASQFDPKQLLIVAGKPVPVGWTGKLWALEQGLGHVRTDLTLCLDADIALRPGLIRTLVRKMNRDNLQLVSLMSSLRMISFWERFLLPAFVYFFKIMYPFRLCNSRLKTVAAAAGGCILIQTRVLRKIGGYASLCHSLIDDCSLAKLVKRNGYRTWIGLTHSALSLRQYDSLASIWNMVARTAFYQLRYSAGLLLLTTITMVGVFWMPVAGVFFNNSLVQFISAFALCAMASTYLPLLMFYGRSPAWVLTLPVIALFYIGMTWTSAIRHFSGKGAVWKGREYR